MTTERATEPAERPFLRIVHGTPDEVELAALTVVLRAAVAASARPGERSGRPLWSDPRMLLRRPIGHGPGAWRASGLPG